MKNIVTYTIMIVGILSAHTAYSAGGKDADRQMILAELVKNIFNVKNNDPVYSLFKDQKQQQQDLLSSLDKIEPAVLQMGEGKLDDHFKKIKMALTQYFSTINSIRDYLRGNIDTGSYEWLNDYEAMETRFNMKLDFERLHKPTIDKYVSVLTTAQKEMNNKFGLLSKPVFKSDSYKVCYDSLKRLAGMVNDLIKELLSGKTWATLPELFKLMKKEGGSSSSFSLFNKKPKLQMPSTLVENGKVVKY